MNSFHRLLTRYALLALLTGAIASGLACSNGPQRAAPVDPDAARAALENVLASWKHGDKLDALKSHTPAITVQDMDWELGYRLLDYRMAEPIYDDANLRCPVELTLVDPKGQTVHRTVKYMVGTDPSITVFREIPM